MRKCTIRPFTFWWRKFFSRIDVGWNSISGLCQKTHLKTNVIAAAYKQMKITNPPIVRSSKEYVNLAVKLAKDDKKKSIFKRRIKNCSK